eukprot:500430_1
MFTMLYWFAFMWFSSYSRDQEFKTIKNISIPVQLIDHASAIHNNILYLINHHMIEHNTSSIFQQIYSFNLSSSSAVWYIYNVKMPIQSPGIANEGQNTVQIGSKLYMINPRLTPTPYDPQSMLIFDLSSQTYVEFSTYSFQPTLYGASSCAVSNNNLIYVIGGWNSGNTSTATQVYQITADSWNLLSDIIVGRWAAGCAFDASRTNIFLFGGSRGWTTDFIDSIERYSVEENKWYLLSETLNEPTVGLTCQLFPYDAKIYCHGGFTVSGARRGYLDFTQIFDPNDYSFETLFLIESRRNCKISMWTDECMIITGGTYINEGLETIEYYGHCRFGLFQPTYSATGIPTIQPTIEPTANPTNSTAQILYIHSNHSYVSYVIIAVVGVIIIIITYLITHKYLHVLVIRNALVLVIGLAEFDDDKYNLEGVQNCVKNLNKLWEDVYKYQVHVCNKNTLYCTKEDIETFVDKHLSELHETAVGAVIVHILTHGTNNDCILTSDLKKIENNFIKNKLFAAKTSKNSPLIKLTFQHTCRGEENHEQDGEYSSVIYEQEGEYSCCIPSYSRINTLNENSMNTMGKIESKQHRSRLFKSNSIDVDEMNPQSDCITVYGTINNRTISDAGHFTNCICDSFASNVDKIIKKDFNSLMVEIGLDLEQRTNNAEICTVHTSLRHNSIRFDSNRRF